MSTILRAKPVVQAIKDNLTQEVSLLKGKGVTPVLAVIRVGNRPDDVFYEKSIVKNCQEVGIKTKSYLLDHDIEMKKFTEKLREINADPMIHGIMIFRPLPSQLDEDVIKYIIHPDKDIDCLNPLNLAGVFEGNTGGMTPCTPAAVMETLRHYGVKLQGANVVVVGRSLVVGKPLSMMVLQENATVTICHSKTKNLPEITRNADVLVAAMGKAKFINEQYVTEKSIVIDVGINDAGDGEICGDVDYGAVQDKVRAITPVPGGIGSITTAILLQHAVMACRKMQAEA
jgi:methylenetetrahydrofolate dehydrogenase (NADP+)/methenyltetrahydrofolate cyclohydrolase